jgi:hypothetical protein
MEGGSSNRAGTKRRVLPESINTDEQKSASSNGLLSPRTHLGATSPVGARVDKKQLLFGLAAFARWAYRR